MDEMEKATDIVLTDELLRNERIFTHPTFGELKIQRPTPRLERLIAEERRKQYHKDLKDKDILSKSEILKLAKDRGIWSQDDEARERQLMKQVAGLMAILESVNYKSFDEVVDTYFQKINELRELYKDNQDAVDAINRYFDLDGVAQSVDRAFLFEHAPNSSVDEIMDEADMTRNKITMLKDMLEARKELNELQMTKAELMLDSMESRSDRAERLAQIYYCCTRTDSKPIWPSFEAAWDARPEDIEAIMMEVEYFNHGLTPETKSLLEKYGFLQRAADIAASSEDSPETQKPSSGGESPESEQLSFSE